ncbi:MAG: hypothetical protein GF313_16230 [Caldithrix sp.]|nr:hypothetical protein [Caldithrix sp.]
MSHNYILTKRNIIIASLIALCGLLLGAYFFKPIHEHWMLFALYIGASNSFIAIPHEPLMIYYGKHYGVINPLLIAIVPTTLGCILDYVVLYPILHHQAVNKNLQKKWIQKSKTYFLKWPFATLLFFAVSPLPFYPIRLITVLSKYPLKLYITAVTLGRIPRYWILLYFGFALNLSDRAILIIFLVLIGIYVSAHLLKKGNNILAFLHKRFKNQS